MTGDYSLCDLNLCRVYDRLSIVEIKKRFYDGDCVKLPEEIGISYDTSCNLHCNICPFHRKKNSPEDIKRLTKLENAFLPYLGNCKVISLSGAGDPFGSPYAIDLIKKIIKQWPNIKFRFLTNGHLLSPNMYFNLGLAGRVLSLSISIHAASAKAYKLVTGSDKFDRIKRHLEFYAFLKFKGEIGNLNLNFVVCTENYRDMPALANMGRECCASVSFTQYRNLHHEVFARDYAKHAIFLTGHPEYSVFMEVMSSPSLGASFINFDGLLHSLRDQAIKTVKGRNKPQ